MMLNNDFVKNKIPLIIYIFLLLYAPPIVKDINLLLIIFLFSLVVIFLKYRKELKDIIKNKYIKKICLFVLIYYSYYLVTIIINGVVTKNWYMFNYFINSYSMFLVFPITFVCGIYVVLYTQKRKILFNELIKIIIICGLMQSAIAILALLFPFIKNMLINIMYYNTGDELYLNQYCIERRFFGFANSLLDSFGFGTGIIAVLPLFYSVNNGKKWLLSVPFLLMVPLLNSRTGLIIFALGVLVWIAYIIKEKKIKKYLDIFAIALVFCIIAVSIITAISPKTVTWIKNDFLSFFTQKKGTADRLFSEDFWNLPNLINCIFGTGYNIVEHGQMKSVVGFSSDVGYINEIWKTGIVGLFIQFASFILLVKYSIKKLPKEYKYFMMFIVFGTLVANVKFYVFSYGPGIVTMAIVILISLLKEEKKNCEKDLISIIVPIYNVDHYLERCLNSIVNQTYKKLEIILVNDGSSDKSEKICKKFLKLDKRIKYIKQDNQGLSMARNRGIKESTGDYYIFVDSDDYINNNFVEELYNTLIDTDSDIAVCDYCKVYDNLVDVSKKEEGLIQVYSGNKKFYNLYNEKDTITTVAWNKIYKREVFSNIEYPAGKVHEDEFIVFKVLDNANKIAYTSSVYYYYFQRKNGITGEYNIKRIAILEAFHSRLKEFDKKNENRLYSYTLYNYYYQLIYQYNMIKVYYPDKKDIIDKLYKEILRYKKEFLLNIYINPLKKLKVLIKLLKLLYF